VCAHTHFVEQFSDRHLPSCAFPLGRIQFPLSTIIALADVTWLLSKRIRQVGKNSNTALKTKQPLYTAASHHVLAIPN
jgi:hypothetical protein